MATAAFKSRTKRTPIGASSADDSGSSNRSSSLHRRARSLSRFSRQLPAQDSCNDLPPARGRFVNTVRGSGFPEISLDDLAIEFFESSNRGRLASRHAEASPASATGASQRRGRSVSRKSSRVENDEKGHVGDNSGGGRLVSDAGQRRRRSVSVVRYQMSDSESDLDHSQNSRSRLNLKSPDIEYKQMHRPVASDQRPVLRKSLSQKDLRSYDGYSSHSSVLTDDEGTGVCFNKNATDARHAVYAPKKAMRPDLDKGSHKPTLKEIKHILGDIKVKVEQAAVKPRPSTLPTGDCKLSNDVIEAISSVRRNYKSKLEESEKRKQDLFAEIVLEEQCGKELSEIVKEVLPETKNNAIEKPSRASKRSNDRSRMSKHLTEEAEKYIEDFLSSVEDADISSLDGERSDTSSSIGVLMKPESFHSPLVPRSIPVEMDGVALPWLLWETNHDASSATSQNKTDMLVTPTTANSIQEMIKAQDQSNSVSSRGSWSPNGLPVYVGKDLGIKFGEYSSCQGQLLSAESKGLKYDMDEYLKLKSNEDLLLERWRQRQRIKSGSLLLCNLRLF